MLKLGQVMLAAKAGATYISILAGRVADEGGNAPEVIKNSVKWLERWKYKSKIIVGSIRSVGDVLSAAMADIIIKTSGKKIAKTYDLSAPEGVKGRNADLTLVKKVLKWEPQISLEEGLDQTYRWISMMVEKDKSGK